MTDSTFNLSALAERLLSEGRLKPLAGKIQDAQRLASLHADLMVALESLDALDELLALPPTDDMSRTVTEAALLNNAIIHYARATQTTSKKRKVFDLSPRFSPEEAIVHQELVDLRNDAIAHFGTGGSYRGVWQVEVVILQVSGDVVRPGVATRRQTMDKKLVARARKQINTARALIRAISEEKIGALTGELNGLAADDADSLNEEIGRHPLNFGMMLASPEAAEVAASAAATGGYIKGMVRHGGG